MPSSDSYVEVGLLGLALAAGLLLLVLGVSRLFRLELAGVVLVAAVRCYFQLLLLGMVLVYLFQWDHPLLTGLVFGLMIFFSAHTIRARLRAVPVPVFGPVLVAVSLGGIAITALVVGVILQVQPLWTARFWLPMGGMVLGNSMTGIAIAVERLFSDLQHRKGQVWTLLSLGASPAEAARPSLHAALRAGLIPIINNMAAVGLVSIPGMMTGQVLAGADPGQAARYQIVVMFMVAAATASGAMTAALLAVRRAFDADDAPAEFLQ